MKSLNFPFSGLLFDEEEHRYYYDGKILKSVTTLLKETLFANKYGDVDPVTLENAAKFGTTVHKALEQQTVVTPGMLEDIFCDVYGVTHNDIIENAELKEIVLKIADVYGKANSLLENDEFDVNAYETEYLVTDGRIAGSVDLIAEVKGEPAIVDYKFTYNADIEYLSWQESIYAYLFYKMTGQRISKAYALWVPKRDVELGWFKEIPMKSDADIERLITGEYSSKDDTLPVEIKDVQNALADILRSEKAIVERKKKLIETLHEFMEKEAITQIKSDVYTISYIGPTTRKSLDSASLKKDHPEIYEQYLKESNVKSTVKVTLK